jgi:hypothetical protein
MISKLSTVARQSETSKGAAVKKPRVAVVAVHGVGDHRPDATSAKLARQLQQFFPAQFDGFQCIPLQLAVDTTALPIPKPEANNEVAAELRLPQNVGSRAIQHAADRASEASCDIRFTETCLAGGSDYKNAYSTVRMHGTRKQEGGPGVSVDLYEMYWADLSHGGIKSGFSILSQLMQLFLHIASVGRTALATLLLSLPKGEHAPADLRNLYAASAWGYWLLAVPILLGNVLLLVLGGAFMTHLVPTSPTGRICAAVVAGLALCSCLGMALMARLRNIGSTSRLERYGLPLIWCAGVGLAALGAVSEWESYLAPKTVVFAITAPALLALATRLIRRYDISRPGASQWWRRLLWLFAAWAVFSIIHIRIMGYEAGLLIWHVYLVEGCFGFLVLAWLALYLNNYRLFCAALFARFSANARIMRSVDTSLMASSIPAPLLLIVVLAIWALALQGLESGNFEVMTTKVSSLFRPERLPICYRMQELIDLSASPAAIPFLISLALALLCAVIAFLPSVAAEVAPSSPPADAAKTRGLWHWLNHGFRLLHFAKWICVISFFFLPPIGGVFQYVDGKGAEIPYLGVTLGGGALIFVSVTKLFSVVSLGRISRFFARLRVMVDTIIDVDNWLRERPVGHTPRLQIMARYVSLLRHLKREEYDRIVLVCHSQGSVITLDLLRYLNIHNKPFVLGLGQVHLLTVGSPLRQLYAARFPAIYEWAENPELAHAGLSSWKNGYGSGDYVGRNLWDTNRPAALSSAGQREFCVGDLAHTHYFDEYSPEVAAAVASLLVGEVKEESEEP